MSEKARGDEKASAGAPVSTLAVATLAAQRLSRGDSRGAEFACQEGLESAPEDPGLLALLGRCLLAQQRHEEAGDALARAVAANPNNGDAHRDLGEVLIRSGRPEAAISLLSRARLLHTTDDPGLEALLARARRDAARNGMTVVERRDRPGQTLITFVGPRTGPDPSAKAGMDEVATETWERPDLDDPTEQGEVLAGEKKAPNRPRTGRLRAARKAKATARALTRLFPGASLDADGKVTLGVDDVLEAILDGGIVEETRRLREQRPLARLGPSGGPSRVNPRTLIVLVVVGSALGLMTARVVSHRRTLQADTLGAIADDLARDTEAGHRRALAALTGIPGGATAAARAYALASLSVDHNGEPARIEATLSELGALRADDAARLEAVGARLLLLEASRRRLPGAPSPAQARAVAGTPDEIRAALTLALKAHPDSPLALTLVARDELASGEEPSGVEHALKANRSVSYPPAHRLLARHIGARGDLSGARRHLDALLMRDPEDLAAATDRALVRVALGEPTAPDEERRLATEANRTGAEDQDTRRRAAVGAAALALAGGNPERAVDILSGFDGAPGLIVSAAALLAAGGEGRASVALARRGLDTYPDHVGLAQVLAVGTTVSRSQQPREKEDQAPVGNGRSIQLLHGAILPTPGASSPLAIEWNDELRDIEAIEGDDDRSSTGARVAARLVGQQAFREGRWADAVEPLRAALEDNAAEDPEIRLALAGAFLKLDRPARAAGVLDPVEIPERGDLDEEQVAALHLRAETYVELGKRKQARLALDRIESGGWQSVDASRLAARLALAGGGGEANALRLLDAAARMEPGNAAVHLLAGQIQHGLGNLVEARLAYARAVTGDPTVVGNADLGGPGATAIARLYFAQIMGPRDPGKAIQLLESATKLDDSLALANFYLARLYLLEDRKDDARGPLERYLELAPDGDHSDPVRAMLDGLR